MSLQINQILFPTDFSQAARNALPFVLEIALKYEAQLHIIHVIEEPYDFAPMIEEYRQQMTRRAENLLQETLDEIVAQERFQSLNIKTYIPYGPTVFSIMDEIKERNIDFVVMGTTGATGLYRVLFGSNTTEVILRSPVPVLAIPEKSTFNGFPHITFLTNYNDEDLQALESMNDLADQFDSDISVVHVSKAINLQEEIMHRGFKDIAGKRIPRAAIEYELIEETSLQEGINNFLSRKQTSLMTMVKYKRPFFTQLLHKSHSKEMGFYTTIPLLILPGDAT